MHAAEMPPRERQCRAPRQSTRGAARARTHARTHAPPAPPHPLRRPLRVRRALPLALRTREGAKGADLFPRPADRARVQGGARAPLRGAPRPTAPCPGGEGEGAPRPYAPAATDARASAGANRRAARRACVRAGRPPRLASPAGRPRARTHLLAHLVEDPQDVVVVARLGQLRAAAAAPRGGVRHGGAARAHHAPRAHGLTDSRTENVQECL